MISLLTKSRSLSIDLLLLSLFLSLIPLLHIKALALHTTISSLKPTNAINVASNETDFHALLAFKSNIFLEHRQALSSWNESLHFCSWEGVQCGCRHERVTTINLTSKGLMGSLSPYIGNLSFLRELSLFNNTFVGEIPSELGDLFRVRSLPPTFGFMFPHLQVLQLYANQFNGPLLLSISNMSQLLQLELGLNNFNGKVKNDFGSLQNLFLISLAPNNFDHRGSDGLAFLSSLTNCSNMQAIGMEDSQFGGVLPDSVGNQSYKLYYLTLGGNQLYGSILSTIGNLVNLEFFGLDNNLFTGSIPHSLGYLHKMQLMSLSNNSISGEIPESIENLS
ncbi:hypothetical protein RHGRI_009931 [Rhododendron griersonianum]|uniref:Leucine-rich repeat-containing N-terminal plant-type domain-containing protein n=1 Tax=Rhododendron griersonianum TaxID=479676 RepID=A0AAV6KGM5_9ERIC|nr:hypothetical protein RHGRI_009931 [Rhododendron griersonianum]